MEASIFSRPRNLYKYRSGSTQDVENLKNYEIWLPTFKNLNDPHDGQLNILIEQAINMHGYQFMTAMQDEQGAPLLILSAIGSSELRQQRNSPEVHADYQEKVKKMQDYYRNAGIYSLSENCDSPQMWAHYGNNSKGFCIEYSLEIDGKPVPTAEAFNKVSYVDEYPKIDLLSLTLGNESWRLSQLLMRKEKNWAYENEWRWLSPDGDYTNSHPLPVTSIIIGSKADQKLIDELKEFFDQYEAVKLKKSVIIPGQFKFGLEPL